MQQRTTQQQTNIQQERLATHQHTPPLNISQGGGYFIGMGVLPHQQNKKYGYLGTSILGNSSIYGTH